MPTFDILCLANSYKRRGTCIVGLRLDGGGWIRPVALTPHGELYPAHYILQDGSCPQLFDRIRISFSERRASAHQPENWLIANQPWQLIRRGLSAESAPLLQSHLVNGPALFKDFSRRILSGRFAKEPAMSSLSLVHPRDLRWRIEHSQYNSHKASAQFQLGGTSYRLPVTDPAWLDAFRTMAPGEYPVTACGIAADIEVLLTISLGEPFEDGYCYKLVAGILPLDSEPLPDCSLLYNPDTTKAFRAAAVDLQNGPPRKRPRELPAQAGKAWVRAEEETLIREFDAGETVAAMARTHGRTSGAINHRLIRMGKIDD